MHPSKNYPKSGKIKEKKKINHKHQAQVHRETKALQLKEYHDALKRVFSAIGIPEAYNMLPMDQINEHFPSGIRTIRVIPSENTKVSSGFQEIIKILLKDLIAEQEMTIFPNTDSVSVMDVFNTYFILNHYSKLLKDKFDEDNLIKQRLEYLEDIKFLNDGPILKTYNSVRILSLSMSKIDSHFYGFDVIPKYEGKGVRLSGFLEFKVYKPEAVKRVFIINGIERTAFKIGITDHKTKMIWLTTTAKDMNLKDVNPEKEYEAYVQSHVFQRMSERIGKNLPEIFHQMITAGVLTKKIVNYKGKILAPAILDGNRVGYFIFDIIDETILIRTFMFLTHDGTPEGDKLKDLLGINRVDKKYLDIDSLKAFCLSDIKYNEEIKKLFIEAGCEGLFQISDHYIQDKTELKLADRIKGYINANYDIFSPEEISILN